MPIYHKKTATFPDEPGAEVNAPEWNDSHTNPDIADITGLQAELDAAVKLADYTPAHSLLVQQSGTGSPSIVQVANNTLVGRLSGGGSDIDSLAATEVRTLLSISNVDNTSDANKPVSTATQTALDLKAPLASPTFTGTVTLPAGQAVNGVILTTGVGTTNFLRADGTYAAPSGGGGGSGDVVGPASSVNKTIPRFGDTTGKLLDDTNVGISDVDEVVLPNVSAPSTPVASTINLFAMSRAGYMQACISAPNSLNKDLQRFLGLGNIAIITPSAASATVNSIGIAAMTTTNFTATARTPTTTNAFTRATRVGYVTAATAGTVGHWRGLTTFTIGNGSGTGGFWASPIFGISDAAAVSGARMFWGVRNIVAPTNVEPSTITNCIGVGHGAADTNLKVFYGGSAAQTPIDLGANFPTNTRSTDYYRLYLFASPTSNNVEYYVERVGTAFTASGTLSGTAGVALPATSTFLGPHGYRTNNATALAVAVDMFGYSHEVFY